MTLLMMAAVVLFGLTLAFAGLLSIAKAKLKVVEDARIGEIGDILPAANCGGCGFAGCADFAKAVVEERAPCSGCPVGGSDVANKIAEILGIELTETSPQRPVIHCGAKTYQKKGVVPYEGVLTCTEASLIGVTQACVYGCMGFGDCTLSCDFDALHMHEGLPVVDYDKCTGCGACVKACPRHLIELIPFKQDQMLVVACSNTESGKLVKQVCTVGCIACKMCQKILPDLFEVKDNLAYLNYGQYTHNSEDHDKAVDKCPTDTIVYFGKPAEQSTEDVREPAMAGETK